MILSEYIRIHGDGGWRNLPKKAGLKRCGKSCRLRWLNYLRPDIKRGNICPDEEELIIRLHRLLGNRWSLIAGRLPGRTDNEIKNYWNTHLSKKLSLNESQHKTSQNLISSSKSPFPVQTRVFKATAVKITTAVRHSDIIRPNGYNGDDCSNCVSVKALKLCNVKETAKSSWRGVPVNDSITNEQSERIASATTDNLIQTEATNCTSSTSNLADQQSPDSDHFAGDAATLAESLLYLNDLSSPDCNLLPTPSDCSTDFASEELHRGPASLTEETNGFEDMCCDQSNMPCVNSFTVPDDQEMEEFFNSAQHENWIPELDCLENSSAQPLSLLLLESEDEWEERSISTLLLEDPLQIPQIP
jgi:hypothetical protein